MTLPQLHLRHHYCENLVIGLFKIFSMLIKELVWILANCTRKVLEHADMDSKMARTLHVHRCLPVSTCPPVDDQQQSICSKYLPNDRISGNEHSDITRSYAECDDTGVTRAYTECDHLSQIMRR